MKYLKELHYVVCIVHVYQVMVYKLVQHYAHTYTFKLNSNMFRWLPPSLSSSGADNTTDQNHRY